MAVTNTVVEGKLIKDLDQLTTASDSDYMILGGSDAKKITVKNLKTALGIDELNSKSEPKNKVFLGMLMPNQTGNSGTTTTTEGVMFLRAHYSANFFKFHPNNSVYFSLEPGIYKFTFTLTVPVIINLKNSENTVTYARCAITNSSGTGSFTVNVSSSQYFLLTAYSSEALTIWADERYNFAIIEKIA